jgi:hypothetical protein
MPFGIQLVPFIALRFYALWYSGSIYYGGSVFIRTETRILTARDV